MDGQKGIQSILFWKQKAEVLFQNSVKCLRWTVQRKSSSQIFDRVLYTPLNGLKKYEKLQIFHSNFEISFKFYTRAALLKKNILSLTKGVKLSNILGLTEGNCHKSMHHVVSGEGVPNPNLTSLIFKLLQNILQDFYETKII